MGRVALMEAYKSAIAARNQRAADIVTKWAAKRQLPPESDVKPITVSGLTLSAAVLYCDMLQPEINGKPHWVDGKGLHLYLGKKHGRCAWVLDEFCSAGEASGEAFFEVGFEATDIPEGTRPWLVWDESAHRHVPKDLDVYAV